MDFFKRNQISLYPYPPYSPDLAPIENIWGLLKNALNKRYKGSLGVGKSKESLEAFKRAIIEDQAKIL